MKAPKHSRTSRVPLLYSPFAPKSFCYDFFCALLDRVANPFVTMDRDTHTNVYQIGPIILPPLCTT